MGQTPLPGFHGECRVSSTLLTASAARMFAFGVWTPASQIWVGLNSNLSGQAATADGAGLAHHLSELVAGLWHQPQREMTLALVLAQSPWVKGCAPWPGGIIREAPSHHQWYRERQPRLALLLFLSRGLVGMPGWKRRAVLNSVGARMEGKH